VCCSSSFLRRKRFFSLTDWAVFSPMLQATPSRRSACQKLASPSSPGSLFSSYLFSLSRSYPLCASPELAELNVSLASSVPLERRTSSLGLVFLRRKKPLKQVRLFILFFVASMFCPHIDHCLCFLSGVVNYVAESRDTATECAEKVVEGMLQAGSYSLSSFRPAILLTLLPSLCSP
jgi:hypothetical protein